MDNIKSYFCTFFICIFFLHEIKPAQTIASCYQEDGLQVMHSPWRDQYNHTNSNKVCEGCPFCRHFDQEDFGESEFVLFKDDSVVVLLTLYPYHDGHIMIFPRDHVVQLHDLEEDVFNKMMQSIGVCTRILKNEFGYEGFNVGANIGVASGASIPDHIHMHIVPRKKVDVGFMQIIGQVKHIKIDLVRIYNKLKPVFDKEFNG